MTGGMVISLGIDERKMGDRGSKSPSAPLPPLPSLSERGEGALIGVYIYIHFHLMRGRGCKRATSRRFFSIFGCCKVYSSHRETGSSSSLPQRP